MQELLKTLLSGEVDGLILATPVHILGMSSRLKTFIDRLRPVVHQGTLRWTVAACSRWPICRSEARRAATSTCTWLFAGSASSPSVSRGAAWVCPGSRRWPRAVGRSRAKIGRAERQMGDVHRALDGEECGRSSQDHQTGPTGDARRGVRHLRPILSPPAQNTLQERTRSGEPAVSACQTEPCPIARIWLSAAIPSPDSSLGVRPAWAPTGAGTRRKLP